LYCDHVEECINKSEGVSINTSLASMIAKVVGNFSLKAGGKLGQQMASTPTPLDDDKGNISM